MDKNDSGSNWDREFRFMQMQLVAMLRHRISWHDRTQIADAIATNRREYESHLKELRQLYREQEHLYGGAGVSVKPAPTGETGQ